MASIKTILIYSFIIFFCNCKVISVNKSLQHEQTNCQSCHLSPPPTGAHEFHLYLQTNSSNITCADCHGLSISKTFWDRKPRREFVRYFAGYHDLRITDTLLSIFAPWIVRETYLPCEAEMRGDTLYVADFETITGSNIYISYKDSILDLDTSITVFPLDTSYFDEDFRQIKFYKSPSTYSLCDYTRKGLTLINRILGDVNTPLKVLSPKNYNVDTLKRLIYTIEGNFSRVDTSEYLLVDPDSTLLFKYPQEVKLSFATNLNSLVILKAPNGQLRQLRNDSIFIIREDSTVIYGDEPFALTTSYHGNGVVDINFRNENTTFYREEIERYTIDPVTQDTLKTHLITEGAWNPKRKTCWSMGVYNFGSCHTSTYDEVPWYNTPLRLTFKPVLKNNFE